MENSSDANPATGLNEQDAAATTTVRTCQWRRRLSNVWPPDHGCSLPVDSAHPSYCILHSPEARKDVDRFNQSLQGKIEQVETDHQWIDLSGVIFPGKADFRDRVFKKRVYFVEAAFLGDADFRSAQFVSHVSFLGALFGGETSFSAVQFDWDASFSDAGFGGEVYFAGARFSEGAYFDYARFREKASFDHAEFSGEASFDRVHFSGEVSFALAHFRAAAMFRNAQFGRKAAFIEAQFSGQGDFSNARFSGSVPFWFAVVREQLTFMGQTFLPDDGVELVDFQGLTSESAQRLRFEHVDLSRVSFLRSDVTRTKFVGCTWAKKADPVLWPLPLARPRQSRNAAFDEVRPAPPGQSRHGERSDHWTADLYRQLRLNFEATRQEVEAGDFYIGQMEMRRQDTKKPWLYRLLLGVYRVLGMYGESYQRPVFWYLLFGAAFALAYLWGGFLLADGREIRYPVMGWPSAEFYQDYVRALAHAITAGGFLGARLDTLSWWVPVVRYLNMLIDTVLVTLLIIALRRRFLR